MTTSTELIQAIRDRNTDRIQALLDGGIRPDAGPKALHPSIPKIPLLVAIDQGSVDVVQLLLQYGASPNKVYENKVGRSNFALEHLLYAISARFSVEERRSADPFLIIPQNFVEVYQCLQAYGMDERMEQMHVQTIQKNTFLSMVYQRLQEQSLKQQLSGLVEGKHSSAPRKI